MGQEYLENALSSEFRLLVTYEDGSLEEFRGRPRTDLESSDYRTPIFPSIIPFYQTTNLEETEPNGNPQLVLRVMEPYDKKIEKSMASEARFTGPNAYDWEFSDQLGTANQAWNGAPQNFCYVPEPIDWIAIHGEGGFHDQIEGEDIPMIASPEWAIMDVDEENQRIAGLRPYFNGIWDAGLNEDDAEMLGAWRGANRGWGRWLHDMDGEFFYGVGQGQNFVGNYDNEMPFAVGIDEAYTTNIRGMHNEVLSEFGSDAVVEMLGSKIVEEEERVAREVENLGLEYWDDIPTKISENHVSDEMSVQVGKK